MSEPRAVPPRPGALARALAALVRGYQLALSWRLASSCRFEPSCSAYAHEALLVHGAGRGTWLAVRRLLRCQPLATAGYDPVPAPSSRARTELTTCATSSQLVAADHGHDLSTKE